MTRATGPRPRGHSSLNRLRDLMCGVIIAVRALVIAQALAARALVVDQLIAFVKEPAFARSLIHMLAQMIFTHIPSEAAFLRIRHTSLNFASENVITRNRLALCCKGYVQYDVGIYF